MNRITKMGISTIAAASVGAGALAMAGTSVASAATKPATAAACSTAARNYGFPAKATSYSAGWGGSVTVAPVNRGTIRVAAVHTNKGWRYMVDSSSGSSVDVYFRSGTHTIKFEAEINDFGGLTIRVTSC